MSIKHLDDLRAQAQHARHRYPPAEASPGSDPSSERIEGSSSSGVALWQAAQACFGTPHGRRMAPVPEMSLEFEVHNADAVGPRPRNFAGEDSPCCALGFQHKKARSSGSRSPPRCTIDATTNRRRGDGEPRTLAAGRRASAAQRRRGNSEGAPAEACRPQAPRPVDPLSIGRERPP
jgi:hypothetical protein